MSEQHAKVKTIPPLIPLMAIIIGWLADKYIYSLPIPIDEKIQFYTAIFCMALAVILFMTSLYFFIKTKQNPKPHTPTNDLYTKGIYRWSRNPIYLGFLMAQIVVGIKFNNLYMILSLPVIMYLLTVLIIKPEEDYLEHRFKQQYIDYKKQVRRWI